MRFTKKISAIGIMLLFITVLFCFSASYAQQEGFEITDEVMNRVYNEVKTPYKYGLVMVPSEPYDELFAHKSYVVKHDGVVYHFYCAVNRKEDRGIAVATSVDKGKSKLRFNSKQR